MGSVVLGDAGPSLPRERSTAKLEEISSKSIPSRLRSSGVTGEKSGERKHQCA